MPIKRSWWISSSLPWMPSLQFDSNFKITKKNIRQFRQQMVGISTKRHEKWAGKNKKWCFSQNKVYCRIQCWVKSGANCRSQCESTTRSKIGRNKLLHLLTGDEQSDVIESVAWKGCSEVERNQEWSTEEADAWNQWEQESSGSNGWNLQSQVDPENSFLRKHWKEVQTNRWKSDRTWRKSQQLD